MDNYDELRDAYTQKAKEIISNWHVEPELHLTDIVRSVMMHRDGVLTGGDFVRAVCNNDLYAAINRADTTCLRYLNIIVSAFLHARINTVQYV
jgi:hypothetical protein